MESSSEPRSSVLVCDSERHLSRLIQVNLERQGHRVDVCEDVDGAILLLREIGFDHVIVELRLRGKSGYELLKWIRTEIRDRAPKINLICQDLEALEEAKGFEFKADSYNSKPFNPNDLL